MHLSKIDPKGTERSSELLLRKHKPGSDGALQFFLLQLQKKL